MNASPSTHGDKPQAQSGFVCMLVVPALFLMLMLPACTEPEPRPLPAQTASPPPTLLQIGVSEDARTLAELVGSSYADRTSRAALNFVAGNSTVLLEDLAHERLDGVLVYEIGEHDDLWFNPVALDGLVPVVHPDNPVGDLTRAELQGLFAGQIADWATIGGAAENVVPIGRERGTDLRTLFNQRIMGAQRITINTLVVPSAVALLATVGTERGAIGYTAMSAITPDVSALSVDGIAATPATTAGQSYPLTVPLYFVSLTEPQGELRAFLAWLQSAEGQAILGERFGRVS
jgi:DNA-binding transcriptional LysR family regulator